MTELKITAKDAEVEFIPSCSFVSSAVKKQILLPRRIVVFDGIKNYRKGRKGRIHTFVSSAVKKQILLPRRIVVLTELNITAKDAEVEFLPSCSFVSSAVKNQILLPRRIVVFDGIKNYRKGRRGRIHTFAFLRVICGKNQKLVLRSLSAVQG